MEQSEGLAGAAADRTGDHIVDLGDGGPPVVAAHVVAANIVQILEAGEWPA